MTIQLKSERSTSRRRRRQNVAPGVGPGLGCDSDIQPAKRAADRLSPATAGSLRRTIRETRVERALITFRTWFNKHPALTALLIGVAIILAITITSSRATETARGSELIEESQQQMQFPEGLDYSKFLHNSQNHARLPCLLCHRRESNAAVPRRPGASQHLPCAGCHAQQFAGSDSPVCTICHTDVKSGALKPFPRLRSFRVKFDHARHTRMSDVNCATCHRPSRGGVALSIPTGFNAHTTCYRCHTPRAQSGGRDISSCGTCHQLGRHLRTPQFAQAFRVGFSHGKHNQMTCAECHQVRAGMPQRRQVTNPEPLNHHATGRHQSCMTCHDGQRAFGGDDFSACKRCHTGATWRF